MFFVKPLEFEMDIARPYLVKVPESSPSWQKVNGSVAIQGILMLSQPRRVVWQPGQEKKGRGVNSPLTARDQRVGGTERSFLRARNGPGYFLSGDEMYEIRDHKHKVPRGSRSNVKLDGPDGRGPDACSMSSKWELPRKELTRCLCKRKERRS
jgi:hypothetical protein